MTRLGLALIWLLHFLPLGLLAPVGRAFGMLLYALARERRKVAQTNLRLCFPELGEAERVALARRHFQAFGRSLIEHGILWWSPKARVQQLIRIEGLEHWRAVADRPVIWLAPHFVGLDMGGIRLGSEYHVASVYGHQKNPVFDAILYHGRTRFVMPELFSRQQGIRPLVKAMRRDCLSIICRTWILAAAIRFSCRFSACRRRPSPACRASRVLRARWWCPR